MKIKKSLGLLLLAVTIVAVGAVQRIAAQPEPQKDAVLKAAEIGPKIFPDKFFYRGKSGTVQMRNTAAIHFGDDTFVLAGLVDTAGYGSNLKEKYQGCLITEVPLEIGGHTLKPGSYGIGFATGSKFVVSDVGANDLLEDAGHRDPELKGPVPLQIVAAPEAGTFRLYLGRDFVTLKRGS